MEVPRFSSDGPLQRGRKGGHQTLGWLTLALLAFAAGAVAARIWWRDSGTDATAPGVVAPVTATPVPPTPALPATPTPTASDATASDAAGSLPTLYIDIAPDDFALIEAKRDEALETWILQTTSDDLVPATVRVGDSDAVSVRLRLKGDWGDHFTGVKWSYRIEVRGDEAVLGMRVFSLQDPSTRSYVDEWAFLNALSQEGVLSVGYEFAYVVQNGEPMGIYAVEEGFSKELLESQRRRESVIIRYNEDLLWENWAILGNDLVTPPGVERFHFIDEFNTGAVSSDPVMAARRDAAVGKLRAWELGTLPASEVFDIDLLARFWAFADLWGARHALYWNNLRYYYNPVTTKLEPIAFDAQPLSDDAAVNVAKLPGLGALSEAGDPLLQRGYVEALWAFTDAEYLASLQRQLSGDLASIYAALDPEFGEAHTEAGRSVLAPPWDLLEARRVSLREMLTPVQTVYAYQPSEVTTDTLTIDVGNLMAFPVEVVGFEVNGTWIAANGVRVNAGSQDVVVDSGDSGGRLVLRALSSDAETMPYARLSLDGAPSTEVVSVSIVTQLWGLTTPITRPVLSTYPAPSAGSLPAAPALDEALARYPYLAEVAGLEKQLTIAPGTTTISESLVLPTGYSLHLVPGTTLRFEPDAYLLARGPLIFEGTEAAPVVLQPVEDQWHGIVVIDAGALSLWTHATIEGAVPVDLPGWTLTGGITFFESPIQLSACRIANTQAEDGINAIRTEFAFVETEFAGTASDAFDSDFSQGTVTACSFHDIGGDAVDVSGTQVTVDGVRVVAVGDKGVSAGESSQVTVRGLSVNGADFGIVSKDMSHVVVESATITGVRIAGLAAYIKKPEYGAATMVADGVTFVDVPEERITLVQTGSWIDLDGVRIWGTDVDIDSLYMKWAK